LEEQAIRVDGVIPNLAIKLDASKKKLEVEGQAYAFDGRIAKLVSMFDAKLEEQAQRLAEEFHKTVGKQYDSLVSKFNHHSETRVGELADSIARMEKLVQTKTTETRLYIFTVHNNIM
jgi:hypothetical protein